MKTIISLACVLIANLGIAIPNYAHGQDKVEVKTVVERLNNPCGVAIQPGTGHVFVSDSGALRVIRIVDGKAEPVITGFPKDTYGKGPIYDIGPLGLVFIDKDTLAVGGGGKIDGEEMLRVYKIPPRVPPQLTHLKCTVIPKHFLPLVKETSMDWQRAIKASS